MEFKRILSKLCFVADNNLLCLPVTAMILTLLVKKDLKGVTYI